MPSQAIKIIGRLPFGRRLALRLYNRLLMHLWPKHRVKTYFGAVMDCDVRDMVQGTLIHFGFWEPTISKALASLIEPGDVVVDVGANVGYYSLLFANAGASVVAIEAHPKLAKIVEHHAEANNYDTIRVASVAVSDREGEVTLYEAPSSNVGMSTIKAGSGFPPIGKVVAMPLDEILSSEEKELCALIKIDIEGAEPPVIRRYLDTIDQFPKKPILAVEMLDNEDWRTLWAELLANGYRAFDLHNDYDWLSMLHPLREPSEITNLPTGPIDILFVPITNQKAVDRLFRRPESDNGVETFPRDR